MIAFGIKDRILSLGVSISGLGGHWVELITWGRERILLERRVMRLVGKEKSRI